MSFDALAGAAGNHCLSVLGAFHPDPRDNVPGECGTLVLLGPDEPRFWPVFAASPEALDGQPDAMDRWSTRVLTRWASALGATALFPFGGPPHRPFYSWALRSGRSHASPVAFLVHDDAGLFVSFRGALALRERLDLPPPSPAPCRDCTAQPCATACPVGALTTAGYDVPACKAYLASPEGRDCVTNGCAVRRCCPVSQQFGRLPAQSAYHMHHFIGA